MLGQQGSADRKLGARYAKLRVTLQIYSAAGHGTARGHGNFEQLAALMLAEYNVLLVQQPGSTPQYNIEDLTIWQAIQLEVDNMDERVDRHREPDLVKVCEEGWKKLPPVKILRGFEMRRDVVNEAPANGGWCETEGKGATAPSASIRSSATPPSAASLTSRRPAQIYMFCPIGRCTELPRIFSIIVLTSA